MITRALCRAGALVFACLAGACGDDGAPEPVERIPVDGVLTPAPDTGDACADVGEARACWGASGEGCVDGVCVFRRTVPPIDDDGAWRCHGRADRRACVPRRRNAGAFDCTATTCTQAQPRLPDAAFWECIDDDGIVVCKGGEPASGVFPAGREAGWICAARRGDPDERDDQICVDTSPDLPESATRGWRCHFEHDTGEKRICVRDRVAPLASAPCEAPDDCARGMICASGWCVPRRIEPACWLDRDCATGEWCRFGTCIEGTR